MQRLLGCRADDWAPHFQFCRPKSALLEPTPDCGSPAQFRFPLTSPAVSDHTDAAHAEQCEAGGFGNGGTGRYCVREIVDDNTVTWVQDREARDRRV